MAGRAAGQAERLRARRGGRGARREPLVLALSLLLVALTLRPQLVGIGPLVPQIQSDLGLSHATAGLLATIPVLCMGLFAPFASTLFRRLGSGAAVGASIAAIGLFGLARVGAASGGVLLAATLGVGMAMGISGALLPVVVKERLPNAPLAGTAAYALGIQGGSALAAGAAVPLAARLGGWRASLLVFSIVTLAIAASWLVLSLRGRSPAPSSPGEARVEPPPGGAGAPDRPRRWRRALGDPSAWQLAVAFALFGVVYYGLVAWLPDSYIERGWSGEAAGGMLALLNAGSLGGTLAIALAGRWLAPGNAAGAALWRLSIGFAMVTLGFLLVPQLGPVWALGAGLTNGAMFPLMLARPLFRASNAGEAAAISGVMLGGGYTIAGLAPVGLGLARDLAGSFQAGLAITALAAVVLAVLLVGEAALSPHERRVDEPAAEIES